MRTPVRREVVEERQGRSDWSKKGRVLSHSRDLIFMQYLSICREGWGCSIEDDFKTMY